MTGAAIKHKSAIAIGRNGSTIGQRGIRLDRDRIVVRQRGWAPREDTAGRSTWPEMGIADQPIKLDRCVSGGSDHPTDQIPAAVRTLGRGREFTRQTSGISANRLAVGSENDFLVHRRGDVEVGFFADKAAGLVGFSRAANPVKSDFYRLVLGADYTLWADDADLSGLPRPQAAPWSPG